MNEFLSSYQNPEGTLKDRLAPRTEKRMENLQWIEKTSNGKTVLDLCCNNGFFTREAVRKGARLAVGVDYSDCIIGAREFAEKEGVEAEFWQVDVESKEFKMHCPRFDTVFLLSALTHMKDREGFLEWLDTKVRWALVFESNHGEKNKEHIKLVEKYMHFVDIEYYGATDIPEKPHYLWVCTKPILELRYNFLENIPVEFVPIDKITKWTEESIMNQKAAYALLDEKFITLREDIRKRGIREPIIIWERNGELQGFQGAHRYFAAKQLGYKSIPCKVLRGYTFKHLIK